MRAPARGRRRRATTLADRAPAFEDTQVVFEVPENTAAVGSVAAADPDAGDAVTYALTGADAGLFTVAADGSLAFASPPDYERPADADALGTIPASPAGDNVYSLSCDRDGWGRGGARSMRGARRGGGHRRARGRRARRRSRPSG